MAVHNVTLEGICTTNQSILKVQYQPPEPLPQLNNFTSDESPTHPGPTSYQHRLVWPAHASINLNSNNKDPKQSFDVSAAWATTPFPIRTNLEFPRSKLTSANTSSPPSNIPFSLDRSLVDRMSPNQRVRYGSSHTNRSLSAYTAHYG